MPALTETDIPKELWAEDTLFMPGCLCRPYGKLLNDYGVMERALSTETRGRVIGGKSREETLEHFCFRYGVSTCRVESLLLDPRNGFGSISDDLIASLSTGKVSILDTPCGTGAAGASLLSTIAVLRANNVVPKYPLT